MEFEIGHMDMLPTETAFAKTTHENRPSPTHLPQSLILNELQKEAEELQNKLKLNNRRLLLFETENNKLLEEKNKLFFETQQTLEKQQIITEKIEALEIENEKLESENDLLHEKNKSFSQIHQAQLSELKRFTKFHLKIQNVIKPYIQQLKKTAEDLKQELQQTKKINLDLNVKNMELTRKISAENEFFTAKLNSAELDRNQTITCYEEQIHSFSKEIIRLEQENDDFAKEIGRLKKSVEFKNYFENELIKFKRLHQDDQQEMLNLSQKYSALQTQLSEKDQALSMNQEQLKTSETKTQNLDVMLESTRQQLTRQMEHSQTLAERLARLEKLNLNLSQQMQPRI